MKKIVVSLVLLLLCYFNLILAAPQYKNEIYENGYHFQYSTSDSSREETGEIVENGGKKSMVVNGFYEYTDLDGNTIQVSYQADENGYRPKIIYLRKTELPKIIKTLPFRPPAATYLPPSGVVSDYGISTNIIKTLLGGAVEEVHN